MHVCVLDLPAQCLMETGMCLPVKCDLPFHDSRSDSHVSVLRVIFVCMTFGAGLGVALGWRALQRHLELLEAILGGLGGLSSRS